MCVIVHKSKGIDITEETLRLCWQHNPNGAGFMYWDNGLVIKKGFMKFKAFYENYLLSKPHDKEIVIHFRLASHGLISPEQTHPFQVQDMGIVHNGIITIADEKEIEVKGGQSDTMLFCKILAKLPEHFLDNEGIKELISQFLIANLSVVVIMRRNGKVEKLGSLTEEFEEDGCWFSNNYWQIMYKKDSIKDEYNSWPHIQAKICV